MASRNGNGASGGELTVRLIAEMKALRRDMNAGFRALIKLGQKRDERIERRLERLEDAVFGR